MRHMFIFAATCLSLLASCAKIEEPHFKAVERFKVLTLGLDEVRIGFGMTYFNPNDFTVTVKETGADVFIDSMFLGRFSQDSVVDVGENADFTVPLSGTIPLTTFFKMDLKDIHKREVLIQANGSTKVGKAGIFITKKINYQGRHRLSQLKL